MLTPFDRPPANVPAWVLSAYPMAMGTLLLTYGGFLRTYFAFVCGGLILTCWLTSFGWQAYRWCRELIMGLDYLVVSLAVFVLAVAVSLGKAGLLPRWPSAKQRRAPD